ncbi:MAG: hypothetical protein R3B70_13010 [Polyangiaceae bacterium]
MNYWNYIRVEENPLLQGGTTGDEVKAHQRRGRLHHRPPGL